MLWFLNWLPHSREPEDGICSLNIFLLSDLRHKSTKILPAEVGATPQITRPSGKEACYISKFVTCGGGPSTSKTAWWLCTEIPSADSVKGWEFFKFMHILLSSNIKCFFFVIVTSACFDCQHFRSQITKARL